jgi:hypothetical protein
MGEGVHVLLYRLLFLINKRKAKVIPATNKLISSSTFNENAADVPIVDHNKGIMKI